MGHNSYSSDYEPVTRSRRAGGLWERDALTVEDEPWPSSRQSQSVGPANEETEKPVEHALAADVPVADVSASGRRRAAKSESLLLKRGHALSYAGLFLYTIAVFFRPYELSPALAWSINISFWFAIFTLAVYGPTQLSLDGKLTVRTKEVNLILLLTVAALLSMPLGISPSKSWEYFTDTFIKIVIMFIVMVNVVRTERRLKGLFFLTIMAGCLSSITAISDYATGNFTVEGYRVMGKVGVYGMFGNPDDMALHLIMMLPITIALAFTTRSLFVKALLVGCALLMLAGTIFSFSRGCFLGLLAVVAVLGWKLGRRNRVVVFVLLFIAAVMVFALAPGYFATRILSIFDHSLDPVGSASARKQMLINSILVALRHPLWGVGMGAFQLNSVRNLGTHNAYMQVAAELGFPALALYVMFMLHPFRQLSRIERETYQTRRTSRFYYLSAGLQASLAGYMVASTFLTVAFSWNIYYLVAYAVCLRRMYEAREGAASKDAISKDTVRDGEQKKAAVETGGRGHFVEPAEAG